MTEPTHFQEPSPACTGSDSDGGSRSRTHLGRARRRSRPPQRWRPRLPPEAVETGEKPSGRPRVTGVNYSCRSHFLSDFATHLCTVASSECYPAMGAGRPLPGAPRHPRGERVGEPGRGERPRRHLRSGDVRPGRNESWPSVVLDDIYARVTSPSEATRPANLIVADHPWARLVGQRALQPSVLAP